MAQQIQNTRKPIEHLIGQIGCQLVRLIAASSIISCGFIVLVPNDANACSIFRTGIRCLTESKRRKVWVKENSDNFKCAGAAYAAAQTGGLLSNAAKAQCVKAVKGFAAEHLDHAARNTTGVRDIRTKRPAGTLTSQQSNQLSNQVEEENSNLQALKLQKELERERLAAEERKWERELEAKRLEAAMLREEREERLQMEKELLREERRARKIEERDQRRRDEQLQQAQYLQIGGSLLNSIINSSRPTQRTMDLKSEDDYRDQPTFD